MSYEILKATSVVIKQIDTQVKQIQENLGAKSAKSFEEYSEQCGVITGLLTARLYLKDLTNHLENSDE
jgi:3-oxoacyl-[acyl-carrier-protein] synthase III